MWQLAAAPLRDRCTLCEQFSDAALPSDSDHVPPSSSQISVTIIAASATSFRVRRRVDGHCSRKRNESVGSLRQHPFVYTRPLLVVVTGLMRA